MKMKFAINHEGILVPVEESKVKQLVKEVAKPLIASSILGAGIYIGFHLLSLFLTGGFPGADFIFHQLLEIIGFGSYFQHPFTTLIQTKSF